LRHPRLARGDETEERWHARLRDEAFRSLRTIPKKRGRPPHPEYRISVRRRAEIERLKNVPCMDCQKRFPACVMDFDHRDPTTKRFGIAQMVSTGTWEEFDAEVAKCDVVCANCHRLRTQKRSHERRGRTEKVIEKDRDQAVRRQHTLRKALLGR